MKQIAIALLLSVAANAQAFTNCTNANGSFSFGIYQSNPVQILVMDQAVSVAPLSYVCEKTALADTQKVTLYRCVGGLVNEEKQIAIYINETLKAGQYQDLSNENNERGHLSCVTQK